MLLAASIGVAVSAIPHGAKADWIASSLDQRCHPDDIAGVSGSVREAIEAAVRRAEASIQAPAGVADLGCLNDLMSAPIDIFSNVGNVMGALQGGVFDSLSFPIDMDVSGMVCNFAAEKWGELTEGLDGVNATISQFANTPASLVERIAGGGGFGSGSGSGGTRPTGSLNFSLPQTSTINFSNTSTGTNTVDMAATEPLSTETPMVFQDQDDILNLLQPDDQTLINPLTAPLEPVAPSSLVTETQSKPPAPRSQVTPPESSVKSIWDNM